MLILIKAFLVTLLADFVSGVVHWLEDVYAKPGMPLVHNIAVNNELHHKKPRAFLVKNWWQSSYDVVIASVIILLIAWWMDALTWPLALFAVLTANANQIHKWAHQSTREKHPIVTTLQRLRILQTPRHHARHHSGQKNSHYCVMTNLLNPVLERIQFWRCLERVIARC